MGTLQGPVICRPAVYVKNARFPCPLINPSSATMGRFLRSGFWGAIKECRFMIRVSSWSYPQHEGKNRLICCSFSSSSDGNGSRAENFSGSDGEYVNSSVIEAGNDQLHTSAFCITQLLLQLNFMFLMQNSVEMTL